MKKRIRNNSLLPTMVMLLVVTSLIQGCGGGTKRSFVHGTVSDIDRNVLVDAEVWVGDRSTRSLITGAYRLESVPSGWKTIRARAIVNGQRWEGSTAAEVLKNEPTMNVNIVLAPARQLTSIEGHVFDDTGYRVRGARVLVTTRLLNPEDSSAYDGPYGSIVAITDGSGFYRLRDVPTGLSAVIAASKVGFTNDEVSIGETTDGIVVDFELSESNLSFGPDAPILEWIESYTMPNPIVRSGSNPYDAIRAFTSPRFREALKAGRMTRAIRSTPPGSLIEIDLYWNALDVNWSEDLAGYGIYRTTDPSVEMKAIDFVRDPYANFYGDMGAELTPNQSYYYAVSAVDVEFLDRFNEPDPAAESPMSNTLSVIPLGQLQSLSPGQGVSVSDSPRFTWQLLSGATSYAVYVYDRFPTLPLDPTVYDPLDPLAAWGALPIWPSNEPDFDNSTVGAGQDFIEYSGPALSFGRTYYWVVLAQDNSGTAFSYSQLRSFTAR